MNEETKSPLETPLQDVQRNTSERELGRKKKKRKKKKKKKKKDQKELYLPRKMKKPVTERVLLCTCNQP